MIGMTAIFDQVADLVADLVTNLQENAHERPTRRAWEAAILTEEALRHLQDAALLHTLDIKEAMNRGEA